MRGALIIVFVALVLSMTANVLVMLAIMYWG